MHGHGLDPLGWSSFLTTWSLAPGWLIAAALMVVFYALARRNPVGASTVRPWRVGSWVLGCVLMWVCLASGIGAYAMSVFWMHMVLHLLLIMVVPALLVMGHPITVFLEALQPPARERAMAVLHSWPIALLTHYMVGLLLYAVVIIGTHLTGFMDQMALHTWLMSGEQVLYVVTGYLFLLPLLGEEPLRTVPSYMMRLLAFLVGMVPDTVVGIVLLQTDRVPFPTMMAMHPSWAPDPLRDVQTAGALMWAAGDGLMMALAVGVMLAVVTSAERRTKMTGAWLDSARRNTLAAHAGTAEDLDPDSDAALDAYNQMLRRMRDHG